MRGAVGVPGPPRIIKLKADRCQREYGMAATATDDCLFSRQYIHQSGSQERRGYQCTTGRVSLYFLLKGGDSSSPSHAIFQTVPYKTWMPKRVVNFIYNFYICGTATDSTPTAPPGQWTVEGQYIATPRRRRRRGGGFARSAVPVFRCHDVGKVVSHQAHGLKNIH